MQPTGADRGEHAVKQGNLDALANAAALPGIQCHGDTDCGLERGVDRRDGNGRVDRTLGFVVVCPKRRRGRAHHPFKGAYPGARIVRGKSRQGTVDELRVGGHGGLSPKSQARHHP